MPSRQVPIDLLFARSGSGAGDAPLVPLVNLAPQMDVMRSAVNPSHGEVPPGQREVPWPGSSPGLWRRRIRRWRWGFSRPQPVVDLVDRDRLVVRGGQDDACIAKGLGRRWVTVRMADDACRRWDGRDVTRLREVVRDFGRQCFYCPVDHPDFRRARVLRPEPTRLDRIRRLLAPLDGECAGLRGLDIGCNMGFMCHHLQRQGLAMTGIDYDPAHLAVANALNETYGLPVRFEACYLKAFQPGESYDIVLLLTVLYHVLFRQAEQDIPESMRMSAAAVADKLDSLTRHVLVWESGPDPAREIRFITTQTPLSIYLPLGRTSGTGKCREMGAFVRPGSPLADRLIAQHTAIFPHEFGGEA